MSKTRSEAIILRGLEFSLSKEAQCTVACKPGYALELDAAGGVKPQATAKKQTLLRIATENLFEGKGIEDTYAIGDRVYYTDLKPGHEAQVRIPAGAEAILRGDQLELVGTGTFRKLTDGQPVAEALESIDNSGGATEVFINIEAI